VTDELDEKARIAEAVAALVRLIREAPDEVIQRVAYGDSYEYEEGHRKSLKALREVIDDLDCRLERQPKNHWHPREPIELVSYGVDGQGLFETVGANALLMISDLEKGDFDYMDYRWHETPGQAFFEGLPERFRAPLMAGFDILTARWAAYD